MPNLIVATCAVALVWMPLVALLVHEFDPLWGAFVLLNLTGG